MADPIFAGGMAAKGPRLQGGDSAFELSNPQVKIPPNLF